MLAGCCAFGVYYYLTHYQRDRNRLRVQAEELDRQAASAAQTATELAEAQDDLAAAQEELASQARDIDRLEQQVNTYQMQGAQNEQSLRELQEENLRLVDENAGYADQVDALNAQLSKLNSRVSTPAGQQRGPAAEICVFRRARRLCGERRHGLLSQLQLLLLQKAELLGLQRQPRHRAGLYRLSLLRRVKSARSAREMKNES